MSGAIDSLSSLIGSILDIFKSIFMTLYHSLESVLSIFTDAMSSIANLGGDFANFVLRKFAPFLRLCELGIDCTGELEGSVRLK